MATSASTSPTTAKPAKKGGIGKIFGVVIGVMLAAGVAGLLILWVASYLSDGPSGVTPTGAVVQKPVDVPSLGTVVKSFTDADCGKTREVALSFGERATFSGNCPILDANVTDGAMLFRYQSGSTFLSMPYATSNIRNSALISVTGASNIKATYKVRFGPFAGPR